MSKHQKIDELRSESAKLYEAICNLQNEITEVMKQYNAIVNEASNIDESIYYAEMHFKIIAKQIPKDND